MILPPAGRACPGGGGAYSRPTCRPPPSRPVDRRVALAGAVALLMVLLAACSGSSGPADARLHRPTARPGAGRPPGPRDGGTLDIGVPSVLAQWSPAGTAWNAAELQAGRAVYDRLVSRDADDVPVPELASDLTPNADFTVWTITVRPGVTFHDGTPLDATAVVANLEAQRTSPVAAALLVPIASVQAATATTVVVTTTTPWSTFPQVLTTQVGYIAAPSVLTGASADPIGTGPFAYGGRGTRRLADLHQNPSLLEAGPAPPRRRPLRHHPRGRRPGSTPCIDGTVDLVAVDEPRQLSRLDDLGDGSGRHRRRRPQR